MAVTKIWKVDYRLDHVVNYATDSAKTKNENTEKYRGCKSVMQEIMEYATNKDKTEKQFFVSGVNCNSETATKEQIENTIEHLNRALEQVQCKRRLEREIMRKDGAELSEEDFDKILKSGYVAENYRKMDLDEKKGFDSLYFMELTISADELKTQVAKMMQDPECGGIFRVKGFVKDDAGSWMQLNATGHEISMKPIGDGQEVVIVIGEQLKENRIRKYLEN